jgi:hypothetical protein
MATTTPIRGIPGSPVNPTGSELIVIDNGVTMQKATIDNAVKPKATSIVNDAIAALSLGTASTHPATDFATAAQGAKADSAVQPGRTVAAGTGLTGGGDLSADRTLSLSPASQASLAKADSAVQPNDMAAYAAPIAQAVPTGGTTGQVLVKASAADNDLTWVDGGTGNMLSANNLGDVDSTVLAAGNLDLIKRDTVSALLADAILDYSAGIGKTAVSAGQIIDGGGFRYSVAASGASDHHVTTAGGVKLYVQPVAGVYSAEAFGLPADDTIDATAVLQKAIDRLDEGLTLVIPPRRFWVTKNTALAGYPGNDQPCIEFRAKKNCRIEATGSTLVVKVHGQGGYEFQLCEDMEINGLYAEGPGNFPPLDSTTGRGEKGVAGAGYYLNSGGLGLGYFKNNSLDTTSMNAGGFGGAFPQWGGGTASTWGAWNGGYIGNQGHGILVHNGCKHLTFTRSGGKFFNGSGFKVGFQGNYFPTYRGYADCEDINAVDCIGSENYDAGFDFMAVQGYSVIRGYAHKCGHPDAVVSDAALDPGYGFTSRYTSYSQAKGGLVAFLQAFDNKRKGLDAHGADGLTLMANVLKRNLAYGIDVSAGVSEPLRNIKIVLNDIEDCGTFSSSDSCAIIAQTYAAAAGADIDTIIQANTISGGRGSAIIASRGSSVIIDANIIKDVSGAAAVAFAAIQAFGTVGTIPAAGISITRNQITGSLRNSGIVCSYLKDSLVKDNIITLNGSSVNTAILAGNNQSENLSFIGNIVRLGSAGSPYNLYYADGPCHSNIWVGGNSAPVLKPNSKNSLTVAEGFEFTVTFNGTSTPIISNIIGSAISVSATTTANGCSFAFAGKVPAASGLLLDASYEFLSSTGLVASGSNPDKLYTLALSATAMEIGIKSTWTGSNINGSTITAGALRVRVNFR